MSQPKDPTDPSGEFEAPPVEVVPGKFVVARPKRQEEELTMAAKLETLKHRPVEVYANGVTYRGILQGSDDEYVYLRTDSRFVQVLMERVSRLDAADRKATPLSNTTFDPSFFSSGEDPEGT
ncbi:MAG: hypothetical protein AB2A00_12695 [Myxococcota bacterium]